MDKLEKILDELKPYIERVKKWVGKTWKNIVSFLLKENKSGGKLRYPNLLIAGGVLLGCIAIIAAVAIAAGNAKPSLNSDYNIISNGDDVMQQNPEEPANAEDEADAVKKMKLISEYVYEADGTLSSITKYEYNGKGRLRSTTMWLPSDNYWYASDTAACKYDSDGNMIQKIDRSDYSEYTYDYKYDESGNMIYELCRNSGISREYQYDNAGNLIKVVGKNADGAISDASEYIYDDKGNRIAYTDYWYSDGVLDFEEAYNSVYDEDGHLLSTKSTEYDDYTNYTYDESWNLIKEECKYGEMLSSTTYTYDEHNRMISKEEEEWGDKITTTYTYDENGNMLTMSSSYGGRTVYEYDIIEEAETTEAWKQAYLSYIETESENIQEDTRFYLLCADDDNIPELYIDFVVYANGMRLCTFGENGVDSVNLRGWGAVSYIPEEGLVLNSSSHHGENQDDVYCIADGKINSVASGKWTDEENESYYWNDAEIDYAAYNSNLQSAFDEAAAIPVGYLQIENVEDIAVGPNSYDYAQIKSILS